MDLTRLSVGDSGSKVARLHEKLKNADFTVPGDEVRRMFFGPATRDAIQRYQAAHSLAVTGIIDGLTAGSLDPQVLGGGRFPTTAERSADVLKAGAPINPQPAVTAAVASSPAGEAGTGIAAEANASLAGTGVYVVTGTVSSPGSAVVGGLPLRLADKNVGQDVVLATGATGVAGEFTFQVQIPSKILEERHKTHPDLQVQVLHGDTVVAESVVRYNASNEETLDIELPAGLGVLPSEYETLTANIGLHYTGSLGELREGDERQDVTYLANKSGWDARAVAMASLADQFGQHRPAAPTPPVAAERVKPSATDHGVGIHPAFYYALFRAGLAADTGTLYRTSPSVLQQVWKQAASQGVMPKELADQTGQALEHFQSMVISQALTAPPPVGNSTLGELLQVTLGGDAGRQQLFADLYVRHQDDHDALWSEAERTFGADTAARLRLDGQLAYLSINNAPLVAALHRDLAERKVPFTSPVDLVRHGYYRGQAWSSLLRGIDVPSQVAGSSAEEQKQRYAELLAAHVRVSFPSAVLGQMVSAGEVPVLGGSDVKTAVASFLTDHQADFDIGAEPIANYLSRANATVPSPVADQIGRLQRVYQLAPHTQAMTSLLGHGLDSAYAITALGKDTFVRTLADALGGEDVAAQVYARAHTVYSSVLHVAMSYLGARQAPALGSAGLGGRLIDPLAGLNAPAEGPAQGAAAFAQATLEDLFGGQDYCACDDCRSIISPAAYLVDLLDFIDNDNSTPACQNPVNQLLARRPDIGALPLTCANTNVPLPYIDLVNETLEYYVGQGMSLAGYPGHNTDGAMSPAELASSPQFGDDDPARHAYTTLKQAWAPAPLPFHGDLEVLRQLFTRLGTSLHQVMKVLRSNDLAGPAPTAPGPFGWNAILVERIGISPPEYQLLTDSSVPLHAIYGVPASPDVIATLSNLGEYSRATGVSYDDIAGILQSRFVNPSADLVPLLQALQVPPQTLQNLHQGHLTAQQFGALLPAGLNPSRYGAADADHVADWVTANYDRIIRLITIAADDAHPCNPATMTLRYLDPDPATNALRQVDLLRMLRFIRLWKKLGLSIQQTDNLMTALCPPPSQAAGTDLQALDACCAALLPRIGYAYEVLDLLGLDLEDHLDELLACWAPIGTGGPDSLYARMFLNPTVLNNDSVFAPDMQGGILAGTPAPTLQSHKTALCAALNLTSAEFDLITGPPPGLAFDATTPMTLGSVTDIYRRGWLARTLGISVLELLSLLHYAGVDAFTLPAADPAQLFPLPLLRFCQLVESLRTAGLQPVQALYLLWNVDLSGISVPPPSVASALATSLRTGLAAVDTQFAVTGSLTPDRAKVLMALVLGTAADVFFGLVNGTFVTSTPFAYPPAVLPQAVTDSSRGSLGYDDLAKQLTFTGYLDPSMLASMQAAAAGDAALLAGLSALAAANSQAVDAFFVANDSPALGLRALFGVYAASADPDRLGVLLRALMPVLASRRRQEQALALVAAAAGSDPGFPVALLTDTGVLHSEADPAAAAIEDFTALARPGLSVAFFPGNDPAAPPGHTDDADPVTRDQDHPLPAAAGGGTAIAARWRGYLAAPQDGDYNLAIAPVPGGTVTLSVNEAAVPMADTGGGRFTNQAPIALRAGTLIPIELTVTGLSGTVVAAWQTTGTGWQPIPPASMFSATLADRMRKSYLRFLKTVALAGDLTLTAVEIAYLAKSTELNVGGMGWAAGLAVDGPAAPAVHADLAEVLDGLLTYSQLKAAYSPASTRLLDALTSIPMAVGMTPLLALTGWDAGSLDALVSRYYGAASLVAVPHVISALRRLDDAFTVLRECHLTADTLIAAATSDPSAQDVSDFQAVVRSRYAESDWLTVVKPVNDAMREMRRDALVSYILLTSGTFILQQLGVQSTASRRPTAEDLFSYFLMDVEMQPCMETSRIRHALSAIQLFIERCLRNLEPDVNPRDIMADEWPWRKRFRVWQANREVFLWPENWLEPTLRDDQSPFFKTTMSSLLQSDITDDTAASAYLDYLTSLEQVAKLEPCGLYYQPTEHGSGNDVAHVIARTSGAHRKYYYRRFQQGSWTPWEEIKLSIEDNPVVPYVWNGRLMLFWLQIHHQPVADPSDPGPNLPHSSTTLASMNLGELGDSVGQAAKQQTREQVSAVLCFSEYYNGKWQPAKTSDTAAPVYLDVIPAGTFPRSALALRPWTAADPSDMSLYVQVTSSEHFPSGPSATSSIDPGFSGLTWTDLAGFILHNTHSAPLPWSDVESHRLMGPVAARILRTGILTGGRTLVAEYGTSKSGSDGYTNTDFNGLSPVQILSGPLPERTVTAQQDVTDQWDMPFFAEDARNVFYVTAGERPTWFKDFTGYGAPAYLTLAGTIISAIPPLVVPRRPMPSIPIMIPAGLTDPGLAQRALLSTGTLRAALASAGSLTFQGRQIGAAGSTGSAQQRPSLADGKKDQP